MKRKAIAKPKKTPRAAVKAAKKKIDQKRPAGGKAKTGAGVAKTASKKVMPGVKKTDVAASSTKTAKMSPQFKDAMCRIQSIIGKQASGEAKMLEICWLLNSKFRHYNWVGFYIATRDRQLVLGPYVGEPTEHTTIQFGSGICGQAAERGKTFVVDDVTKESNYLACSLYVRSEIVIPIFAREELAGELDIDSHVPKAFTAEDRAFLQKVCGLFSEIF